MVPRGFAAYARVLHPARDEYGDEVGWAQVYRPAGQSGSRNWTRMIVSLMGANISARMRLCSASAS